MVLGLHSSAFSGTGTGAHTHKHKTPEKSQYKNGFPNSALLEYLAFRQIFCT